MSTLVVMGETRGVAFRALLMGIAFLCGLSLTQSAAAQTSDEARVNDAAARAHFELGREDFETSEYELALEHFKEAYALSGRAELLYNIGITASRLQRDDEALAAFERYLDEVQNPARELEVRKRAEALRQSSPQGEAAVPGIADGLNARELAGRGPVDAGRIPTATIVGASVLGAVGVAGVAAMGVGLARSGGCVDEVDGVCVTRRTTSPWVGVYGALGLASLAGGATWFAVSAKRAKDNRRTAWMLTPTGLVVSGSF